MPEVTIKVDNRYRLSDVARDLRDNGFVLTAKLENLGVLIGTCPAPVLSKLADIRGVVAVERERKTSLID